MPTYDYKCPKCGKFQVRQSIKEDALEKCPKCGEKIERLISKNVGVVLNARGFYSTDHR